MENLEVKYSLTGIKNSISNFKVEAFVQEKNDSQDRVSFQILKDRLATSGMKEELINNYLQKFKTIYYAGLMRKGYSYGELITLLRTEFRKNYEKVQPYSAAMLDAIELEIDILKNANVMLENMEQIASANTNISRRISR